MLLEGITLACKTSSLSLRYESINISKMNKLRFWIGWCLPAIIVVISAGIGFQYDTYMSRNKMLEEVTGVTPHYRKCWLNSNMFIFSVAFPIGFIILVNTVILIRIGFVVYAMASQANNLQPSGYGSGNKNSKDATEIKATLKAVVTLIPILGIPYILGFLVGKLINVRFSCFYFFNFFF